MNQKTITHLNLLNKKFYQKIALHFSATREQPWKGWRQLTPFIEGNTFLDLGCGNGRFAEFLHRTLTTSFHYLGVDNSPELLAVAKEKLVQDHVSFTLFEKDIIEELQAEKPFTFLSAKKFDGIFLFGVMHHIPSFELRKKLFFALSTFLETRGKLIFTAWQFTQDDNLLKRQVPSSQVSLSAFDIEENDYFLTWERGEQAVRYCHLVTEEEVLQLIENTPFTLLHSFSADGKEGNLNTYYILEKN